MGIQVESIEVATSNPRRENLKRKRKSSRNQNGRLCRFVWQIFNLNDQLGLPPGQSGRHWLRHLHGGPDGQLPRICLDGSHENFLFLSSSLEPSCSLSRSLDVAELTKK